MWGWFTRYNDMENDVTKPENAVLRILQEMRKDFADMRGDVAALRGEPDDLRTDTHGNTLILNILVGDWYDPHARASQLGGKGHPTP